MREKNKNAEIVQADRYSNYIFERLGDQCHLICHFK